MGACGSWLRQLVMVDGSGGALTGGSDAGPRDDHGPWGDAGLQDDAGSPDDAGPRGMLGLGGRWVLG